MEKNITNNYGKLLDSMRRSVRQSEISKREAAKKGFSKIPRINMPLCRR